jgi:hypothetical protein
MEDEGHLDEVLHERAVQLTKRVLDSLEETRAMAASNPVRRESLLKQKKVKRQFRHKPETRRRTSA